jgi:glycosyltransferase involved in cell wall biosynthesis
MQVLLIHQAFATTDDAGGTRHFELAQYAAQKGIRFTVITSGFNYLTGQSRNPQGIPGGSVRVRRAWACSGLHRSFVWRLASFLTFMASSIAVGIANRSVDVVMGTSPPIFQAFSASLVAALRRKPFLLEVRDLWPEFAVDMGVLKNPTLIFLSRMLESFLYRRATAIVVNSPAYREYLITRGVPPGKISVVANGADNRMFNSGQLRDPVRRQLQIEGRFVVTYTGALGMANDIATILRAAGRLSSHTEILFLLVGDGKERAALENTARQMGLSNVLFTGALPKSEIPGILAASDACVATLLDIRMFRTTYPNKVFDYMAAGRPCILAIDGVIREVVEAAGAGIYVPPGNDEALAHAVLKMQLEPESAARMGLCGQSYVAQHFSREHQAGHFASILQKVAAPGSGAAALP